MAETIRKISEKVQDEVYDIGKKLGVAGPKKRTAYDADTTSGGRSGKPTRNQAVVWDGPNKVSVADIGYPEMKDPQGNAIEHGVILKVVASAICGSDLHMYRGNIGGAKRGMTFGHEITGEVFEMGSGVERFDIGDIVSVPFNVSCGKCDNCRESKSCACLKANPAQPGGAYGYAGMGGWQGGQSEYVLVPWADFQLLKLPKEVALKRITSLAFLSDIYPTGYNGALQAGVKAGSIVYVAGAGPVGLCCAQSCFLLGASVVFISDKNPDRLALAKQIGCKTIDLNKLSGGKADAESIMNEIERQLPAWKNGPHKIVDCAVDCVGYECCGIGSEVNKRVDEQVLNTCFQVTKAGGGVGIPGLYPKMDPSGPNADNRTGVYHLKFGVAWEKGLRIGMGQCPVLDFNKDLLKTLIYDERIDLGKLLNVKMIPLSEAVNAYKSFDQSDAVKYVFDPHGICGSSTSSSSK